MMNQKIDMPEEETLESEDDFGAPDPREKPPFWKRDLPFGHSLPWLLGITLLAVAILRDLALMSLTNNTPSETSFSEVENTLDGAQHSTVESVPQQAVSPAAAQPEAHTSLPMAQDDRASMMTDIRDELNDRDRKINDSLTSLKDSVTRLSDAIKRDEAYAVETRAQLNELTQKLAVLETRVSTSDASKTASRPQKRQTTSAVAGMKIMSLEAGMAWIKWQGSTWSVREGDTLGKVTIRQIDPATRSVVTTGGTLR
ncbi:conjugal transfer protein TraP [Enterobacter hormaechei]|uniref:conjugal transfer protein TraP n=1 Tax=Enterobacter hormaechei TaxID=158836 RepID=UPI00294A0FA4|nr:conjugal transfer protein TraP [Enterobacter hormaechei]MDV5232943.1 conjugal transfer protein TraP [Enterobacter hormaechei]